MKKITGKRKLTEPTQTEKKTAADPKGNNDLALPLPRPERKKRKPKEDRGLPPDDELKRLAEEYLKFQRAKWPDLVELGHLPKVSESIINVMVKDFKNRHRTAQPDSHSEKSLPSADIVLAGFYGRYSCDNSDPTSILDQQVSCLKKAREEDRFIPWIYVFCDYSVSGLDRFRQGYTSYKEFLTDITHRIETTYIDDFTRASRDEIDWWKLAQQSKRLKKRMIGASDGFDLSSPDWDVKITLYGLVSRLFIKGLRQKVRRGMTGAARRGGCLGKLPLGFTRRPILDENGNPACRPDGQPKYEPCPDPNSSADALLLFELFTQKNWSAYKITRFFNEEKIEEWDGWTEKAIKQNLWNPAYIGVFIWNRTRREYDWETEKMVVLKNPRSEWEVKYNPDLAIIPLEWWRKSRKRLAEMRRNSSLTGRKKSRNQLSANTLFSGTLFCGYCDKELTLCRSTPKYKSMYCHRGSVGSHQCQLSTSKSTRIIEKCLLDYFKNAIFTKESIESLVTKSNDFLKEEMKKPKIDISSKVARIRKTETKIQKLVKMVENEPEEVLCQGYHQRIVELQGEVIKLKAEVREADRSNADPPPPITMDNVEKYLEDFRSLLNQEIEVSAEAIRTLTGPITIKQEAIPGRKNGATWIASFQPDLLSFLRLISAENNYPDSITLEYLKTRNWITPRDCEVRIEKIPRYEELADMLLEMHENGSSIQTIASAYNMSWEYANQIVKFAKIGERPKWKAGKRTGKGSKTPKCIEIKAEVDRRRIQKHSFKKIARDLGVSQSTVVRAYDLSHSEEVLEAAKKGETPDRGKYQHISETTKQKIRRLIEEGKKSVREIALELSCSENTVRRER